MQRTLSRKAGLYTVWGDRMGSLGGMSEAELKAVFVRIDTDGSGLLDRQEIERALRKMRKTEQDIQKLLSRPSPI